MKSKYFDIYELQIWYKGGKTMPKFDGSERVIDVLKNRSSEKCPACGESMPEKRIFGGAKNGRDEPFDERIICPNCGADLTAESDESIIPLNRTDREILSQMYISRK